MSSSSSSSFFTKDVDVDFLFGIADYDKDGVVNINDATRFFSGAYLSVQEMGTVWMITVTNLGLGILTRENFGKALTLISLTQKRLPLNASSLSPGVLDPPMFMDLEPAERAKYELIFTQSMDPATQKVSGQTALGLFTTYGIDRQVLFKVWQLADMDLDGSLSGGEFLVAMALIKCVMSGHVLPNVVPSTLLYSIANSKSVNAEEIKAPAKPKPRMPVAATQSMFVGTVAAAPSPSSSLSSSPSPAVQQSQGVSLFDDKDNFFSSASGSASPSLAPSASSSSSSSVVMQPANEAPQASSKSEMFPQKSSSSTDLFGGSDNLFSDQPKTSNLFDNSNDGFFSSSSTTSTATTATTATSANLFDNKDNLFSSPAKTSNDNSKSASSSNLFDNNDSFFPSSSTTTTSTETTATTATSANLFDDKDNLFSSPAKASNDNSKSASSSNLFDNNNDGFFSSSSTTTATSTNLFDDKDNLFSSPAKTSNNNSKSASSSNLFDNNDSFFPSSSAATTSTAAMGSNEPSKTTDLFGNSDNLFLQTNIPAQQPSTDSSKTANLFDDKDNLFSSATTTTTLSPTPQAAMTATEMPIDTEELKEIDEKIAAIQKEFNEIHESVETKKVQAQAIKDRNASLVTQQDTIQRKCKSIQDEAILREMDLEHAESEIEKNKGEIKAAEDGIEESTRNIAEAKAKSEKLSTELSVALTKYSDAFTANSTQREVLTKEKEKLRATETAKLPDNPLDALPKSRIFGPEFAAAGNHKKDPFDTSDMVMQAPNLWCYEPFKFE